MPRQDDPAPKLATLLPSQTPVPPPPPDVQVVTAKPKMKTDTEEQRRREQAAAAAQEANVKQERQAKAESLDEKEKASKAEETVQKVASEKSTKAAKDEVARLVAKHKHDTEVAQKREKHAKEVEEKDPVKEAQRKRQKAADEAANEESKEKYHEREAKTAEQERATKENQVAAQKGEAYQKNLAKQKAKQAALDQLAEGSHGQDPACWVLLIGDSNFRKVYRHWAEAAGGHAKDATGENKQWADSSTVINWRTEQGGKLVMLGMRFITAESSIQAVFECPTCIHGYGGGVQRCVVSPLWPSTLAPSPVP